jgi:hypothetical protein
MSSDRTIGRIVKVKTYQALVELSPETSSYVKSSYGGLYAIAVINSFVIVPVGSERVVAIVTGLDMAEEPDATLQNRQMLVIARPRRTMWVSMIGTITQSAESKHFEYGVKRYPELDNPVWFASEDDLDIIFDKARRTEPQHITIGKSPIFTDYDVTIDIDRFFGKHAAILGNTGAGKSCTVTAIIKAVLERGMPNAHFIVLDTNNEYEQAFTIDHGDDAPKELLYDRLVLRNEGDTPKGLVVPHWFMNGLDYQAFFRPGEGAQAPLLFKAIGVARGKGQPKSALLNVLHRVEEALSAVDTILLESPKSKAAFKGKEQLREQLGPLNAYLDQECGTFASLDLMVPLASIQESVVTMLREAAQTPEAKRAQYPSEPITALIADRITKQLASIREQLVAVRQSLHISGDTPTGIDTPLHFDFNEFVDSIFSDELQREAARDPKLRSYVGTLQLRLEQARQDPRYAFLFQVKPFDNALASFLRLLLGLDPAKHFDKAAPPWATAYREQHPTEKRTHQITILDLSELSSDVLENVTALLGRLVLDFMQRIPERASFPVVLVLEEAHRYIPNAAPLDRQQRARDVFEKIAKEGRKFGLSLLVASQRPSELSRTVLAQCNSFIVHRIQNPDDQEYFRSVISGINRELLDQLPALAQQQAIVMGDCVTLPLQVRINTISPRPRSVDPEFVRRWSNLQPVEPNVEGITARWEGRRPEPGESQ